jgi:hypothetical protein
VLYQQQGKLEQAVGYFERFFELARSLGEHLCCLEVACHMLLCCKYDQRHAARPQGCMQRL